MECQPQRQTEEDAFAFTVPEANAFGNEFREYESKSDRRAIVEETYRKNHVNQTFAFVEEMHKKHLRFDKAVMGMWECVELLNEFVDESDPDLDMPQIQHLLQTAEAIRIDYPREEDDWFPLTGFIHDLGKVLLHSKFGGDPQWAVVGDTFPVGCAFDKTVVHYQHFKDNPDSWNPKYNTKNGMYEEGCGLDNVYMSWGHDEYMYQVMKRNHCKLPPPAYFIVRYHSFYAMHREGGYKHLMNDFDKEMLPWLHAFNKYDLYSKSAVRVNVEEVKPYYCFLIQKYFGTSPLQW